MSLDIWLQCDHCQLTTGDLNYTHNVSPMWREAGCYDALYNSDGKRASETLEILNEAIKKMSQDPEKYRALNPSNGWGNYDSALQFLRDWRTSVENHPDMIIRVSR